MTEEPIDENENTTEVVDDKELGLLKDNLQQCLSAMYGLPIRSVSIVFIPKTGELVLNTSVGMPRHELLGLLEAVRDETRK